MFFKVRTADGKRYILRYDENADTWSLQSGFDGDELLALFPSTIPEVPEEAIRLQRRARFAGDDEQGLFQIAGLFHRLTPGTFKTSTEFNAGPLDLLRVQGFEMVRVSGNAPELGTHLVRFRL